MTAASNLHTPERFVSGAALASAFAEQLGRQIIAGRYKPGERLVETRLAAAFGISRSPVREGLRLLANDGLVLLVERRGAIVKPLDPHDIQEAFECRMALQGLAARLAAERWREPQLAPLRHALAEMEAALARGDVEAYYNADIAYHETVCWLSQNARLQQLLGALGREMLRLRFLINSIPGRQHESIVYNRGILAAIEARDAAAAERLTRELTASGCQRLLETMRAGSAWAGPGDPASPPARRGE
jgi:DNA-binding GntR family transcriptional regulator